MEIDYKEEICPVCGYEFPPEGKIFKYLVLALIIIFIIFLIITQL